MTDTLLDEGPASAAVTDLGWRYLLDTLTTAVPVDSLAAAAEVLAAVVGAAGADADGHLRVHATADRVELTVQTAPSLRVSTHDVALARAVTDAVRATGRDTVPRPGGHPVQAVAVAIDAMDVPAVRAFWQAVLGYDAVDAPVDLVDPTGGGPTVWFQQMDAPRPQRNRIHLDVTVPHDEAEARVAAALAAGGRLVSAEHARAFWVLADVEGNEACVCTWQDRS